MTETSPPRASVIVSTYEQPEWLEKTLTGYMQQREAEFDIIVADDGSGERTREVVDSFSDAPVTVRHVWHPDDGFRKNTILNKAVGESSSPYLIFTDGDCIPREDFVATHLREAEPDRFLSGGAYRLTMEVSHKITGDEIVDQTCFDAGWLRRQGEPLTHHLFKLTTSPTTSRVLNQIVRPFTPTSFNGNNASCWRRDFDEVGGFDERMAWGGEDRELGERLTNAGKRGKMIRYSAVLLHLDHSRPYIEPDRLTENRKIRSETRRERRTRTSSGVASDGVPTAD